MRNMVGILNLRGDSAKRLVATSSRTNLPYLLLIATSIVGGNLFEYAFRSVAVFKGQSFGLLFALIFGLFSLALWIAAPGSSRVSRNAGTALILLIGLWFLTLMRTVYEGSAFNYTAFLTPIFLFMIWVKSPNHRESRLFGDFVGVALAGAAVITQVLDWTGLRSFRTDIQSRWEIPIPWLDIPARWEGMFGDPNNAGFIGAFLVIYGLKRSGPLRAYLVGVGSLIVLLSESRTAVLAMLIGIAILCFNSLAFRRLNFRPRTTITLLTGLSAVALLAVALIDPTLNGRIPIWRATLSLLPDNLLIGVGSRGIDQASRAGVIPWKNSDAHSILIDSLARNGIGVFLLATALLLASFAAVIAIRRRDQGLSLAITCTFCAAALTYTITSWLYLNVQMLPLLVALLLANSYIRRMDHDDGD